MDEARSLTKVLSELISDYEITYDSLSKITNIPKEEIQFFHDNGFFKDISDENKYNFFRVLSCLDGMTFISEDDRISSIMDLLMLNYNISTKTISMYSRIDIEKIKQFIENKVGLSDKEMYRLSVTILFLHFVFNSKK